MLETYGNEADFPDFPIPNTLTGPLRKAGAARGNADFVSLWAGQAAGIHRVLPAGELLERLVEETNDVLKRLG